MVLKLTTEYVRALPPAEVAIMLPGGLWVVLSELWADELLRQLPEAMASLEAHREALGLLSRTAYDTAPPPARDTEIDIYEVSGEAPVSVRRA